MEGSGSIAAIYCVWLRAATGDSSACSATLDVMECGNSAAQHTPSGNQGHRPKTPIIPVFLAIWFTGSANLYNY